MRVGELQTVKERGPLEGSLFAVDRQLGWRGVRVAFLGTVQFADLAEMDFRETNLELLVLLVAKLAIPQLAFDREVRAFFQCGGERRKIAPRDHPVPLGAIHVLA